MNDDEEKTAVNEENSYPVDPYNEPDAPIDPGAFTIDPPDKIIRDLLQTEKDMANEAMTALRSKYDSERQQWDKIIEEKQREILSLRSRLQEAEERARKLQVQAAEERELQVEQMRINARDMEVRRQAEAKKWEMITDELRDFREVAQEAQKKLQIEQEQVQQLKRQLAAQEECWKGQLSAKEDEQLDLKEKLLRKEEILLTSQTESGEKVSVLQEKVEALEKTLGEERHCSAAANEKKDADLATLRKGIQDAVIGINAERQKKEEAEAKIIELQEQLGLRGEELAKVRAANEQEMLEWKKGRQNEVAAWEKAKQEFIAREEAARKDLEEQIKLVSKSLAIAEQQLAEEQRVRAEGERALARKETALQQSIQEKDETVVQWRQLLESDQQSWKKRLADIQNEFEQLRRTKDEEIAAIRKELKSIVVALDEEKRLFLIEKEENEQNQVKVLRLEEDRQRLVQQLENKEKEWQIVLVREQELLQKQIEELRAKHDAQTQSREMEITRLNEDLNILNGQLQELRQKFALERNENNNRLTRIQEYDAQVRALQEQHKQECMDWERKVGVLKEQMEQQRKNAQLAQEEAEVQSKKDLQLYRDKVNRLNTQVNNLQRTSDFESKPIPTAPAEQAPVASTPPSQEPGSVVRSRNRYYPGK